MIRLSIVRDNISVYRDSFIRSFFHNCLIAGKNSSVIFLISVVFKSTKGT